MMMMWCHAGAGVGGRDDVNYPLSRGHLLHLTALWECWDELTTRWSVLIRSHKTVLTLGSSTQKEMSCYYNYRSQLSRLTALHWTDWWWAAMCCVIVLSVDLMMICYHWGGGGVLAGVVGYGCGDAWTETVDNDYHPVTGTRTTQ